MQTPFASFSVSERSRNGPSCLSLDGFEAVDRSPIRSPLVVAEHLIEHARGKVVLEVGTRNGDILDCVSRFALKVFAAEIDEAYCEHLKNRGLSVICGDFNELSLAQIPSMPQVFFWWPMVASDQNEQWLSHVRDLVDCRAGDEVVVIIAFDNQWEADVENKAEMLKKYPSAVEHMVWFNEGTAYRTFGTFSLLHFDPCQ